jgi:F-type H+-transporting ATPase subunit b
MLKVALAAACVLWLSGQTASAQPPAERHAAQEAAQPARDAAGGAAHAASEHGMLSGLLWPTANFIILVGVLYYLLNKPLATYLSDRGAGIRRDLVDAAAIKRAATSQLDEIDRKLKALPGEIDALRTRGTEEIAAEEQRIATAAAAERERLLEQTRHEIDLRLRLARRELAEHAAELAVQLATDRVTKEITPADQTRLVDRYLTQVKG